MLGSHRVARYLLVLWQEDLPPVLHEVHPNMSRTSVRFCVRIVGSTVFRIQAWDPALDKRKDIERPDTGV